MAPEQGPDSKSHCGKKVTAANEEESAQQYENNKPDDPTTSQSLQTDSFSWIYLLRKDQLIEQCQNVGIPTKGYTVEYLRKQLAENLRSKRLRTSTENLLRELEEEIQSSEKSVVNDEIFLKVPTTTLKCNLSDTEIMSIIQQWNLSYSGDTNLMEFLERFEELAESYHIPFNRLLPALIIILQGNALKWYRVKRDIINTWLGFKEEIQKFFLPGRYLSQLEQNFYNRKQYARERAKDYILTMLTLSRQHPQLRKINHLDRIYDGLRTEYRHYVRRNDFINLDDLIFLTDDFEALKREERPQTSHMIREPSYNRASGCRRCKQSGLKDEPEHSYTLTSRDFLSQDKENDSFQPPPLAYFMPVARHVRIAHNSKQQEQPKPLVTTPRKTPSVHPGSSARIIKSPAKEVGLPIPVITTKTRKPMKKEYSPPPPLNESKKSPPKTKAEERPTTSKASAEKKKLGKKSAKKCPRLSEEEVFRNVKISKPKAKPRRMQYIVHRESLPTMKVKIIDGQYARLQCQGYEKIVEML